MDRVRDQIEKYSDFEESKSGKEVKGGVLGRNVKGYLAGVGLSVLVTLGVESKHAEATPPANVVMRSAADMYEVANYPNPQLQTFNLDGEPRFDVPSVRAHVVEGVYASGPGFVDANTGNVLNITGLAPFVNNLYSFLSLPDRVAFVTAQYSGSINKYYLVDFNTLTAQDVTPITNGHVSYLCHASDSSVVLVRSSEYFLYNFVNKSFVQLPSGSFDTVRNNIVSQYPSGLGTFSQSVTKYGAYLAFGSYVNGIVVMKNPEIEQPATVSPEMGLDMGVESDMEEEDMGFMETDMPNDDMVADMDFEIPDKGNQMDMVIETPDMGIDSGGSLDMGLIQDMELDMGGSLDMGTTSSMEVDMPNGENPVQPKPDPVNPSPSNPDTGAEDEGGCAVVGVEGGKPTDPAGIVLGVGVLVGGVMARRKRKIPKSGK